MKKTPLVVLALYLVASLTSCSSSSSSAGTGGTTGEGGANTGGNAPQGGSAMGGSSGSAAGGSTGPVATGGASVGGAGGTAANSGGVRAEGGSVVSPTGGGLVGGSVVGTGGAVIISFGGEPATGGTTVSATGGSTFSNPQLVTSASGSFWKTGTWTEATTNATVTVNDTTVISTWEGFGGAFNEMGWSYLTTKGLQDQALQLLYGADGAHFAWGRIPMGASDYAMDRYTLDETPNDTAMSGFSIARDKQKLIPYIKAAQAVRSDIRFWASPWTPPTWMKSSPYQTPGSPVNAFDGGKMKSDDAILKAHAQYFVKFVQAYAEQGINIDFVAPQNEPNYSQNYPSCIWDPTTFTTFIGKYLGPALTSANVGAQVMLGTMSNNGGSADVAVANAVLADATAKGYCKVMGVQWGMSDKNQVDNLKGKGPGIPIWLSEHKCGGNAGANVAAAPNDLAYGKETWNNIRDAIKNGLTAYNAWNMVLDKAGKGNDNSRVWAQNALLVVDAGQITQTPAFHVFRHFSQFVEPGAKVVGTTGGDAVAFKNPDGSIIVVMYNSGSANNAYTVSIGGKKLQFAMPSAGWATVNFK